MQQISEDKTLAVSCCFHYDVGKGVVDYIGDIVDETNADYHVDIIDTFMVEAGFWVTTGQIMVLPKDECILFNDRNLCVRGELVINGLRRRTIKAY